MWLSILIAIIAFLIINFLANLGWGLSLVIAIALGIIINFISGRNK